MTQTFNIDYHHAGVVVAAVLSAGKVVGIEAEVVVVGRPAKQVAVADAARPEVVLAVEAETVRIAGVHQKTAVEAVETVLAAVLLRPNVAAVPSSWRRLTALEKSAQASAATAAAYQVVEEDARPWTLEAEEAEECSPVGIHPMVAAAQAAEADGQAAVLESTVAAAVARPFRDASHDAENDA